MSITLILMTAFAVALTFYGVVSGSHSARGIAVFTFLLYVVIWLFFLNPALARIAIDQGQGQSYGNGVRALYKLTGPYDVFIAIVCACLAVLALTGQRKNA